MSARCFLDTNIFVYSFDRTSPIKSRRAALLIEEVTASGSGIVSYQVIQEFFHIALKRFAKPMTFLEADQYLRNVLRPMFSVHSSIALFAEALSVQATNRLSWYDSLIVAAAIQAKCDLLYTEDLQHGQRFGNLQIVNPFL